MNMKRGIEKAVKEITANLQKLSKPTQDQKEIAQVGTISANGDTEIGEIIAKAMERVGKDGTITVEEGERLRDYTGCRGRNELQSRLPLCLLHYKL